jgi:hypothetical protein
MLEVNKLYPQYKFVNDRRKHSLPVSQDRRSGLDRRSGTRIQLDTNLTRDIFDVKSKIAQSQNVKAENKASKIAFTQNISKAVQHALPKDVFIKSTKPAFDVAKETANIEASKKHASDGMLAGVLATVFVGTVAAAFMGVAGVGIALALGGFMGGKAIKNAVSSHLKK